MTYSKKEYIERERDRRIGEAIIDLLDLHVEPSGKVYTTHGMKTPIGLTRAIREYGWSGKQE